MSPAEATTDGKIKPITALKQGREAEKKDTGHDKKRLKLKVVRVFLPNKGQMCCRIHRLQMCACLPLSAVSLSMEEEPRHHL
jgi:hypothetical protein